MFWVFFFLSLSLSVLDIVFFGNHVKFLQRKFYLMARAFGTSTKILNILEAIAMVGGDGPQPILASVGRWPGRSALQAGAESCEALGEFDALMSCHDISWYGYGSIPISTIFSGINIHLPAILMFTRGTRFWHTAIWWMVAKSCTSW